MDGIVRMRTIAFTPDRAPTLRRIRLGYEGDNLVERLEFDLPEIAAGQTATLMITGADAVTLDRTDEGRYAVDLTRNMIGPDGEREAYVRIDGTGGEVWQSAPMRMTTGALPDVEEEIEKVYPTAVGQMLTAMAEHSGEMAAQEERVEQAAQRAEEAAEKAEAGGGGSGSGGSTVEIDATLTVQGAAADAKAAGEAVSKLSKEIAENDIPKIYFTGTTPTSKDEGDLRLFMRYISKTARIEKPVTLKVQGSSSVNYPKKNFTMKVYADGTYDKKEKLQFRAWPAMNKFVLKAHWMDHSHVRNVGTAKIWGKMVASRSDYASLPEELRAAANNGATDGFTCKVFVNGVYQGLYELIVPKDALFGQDKDVATHSIMCSEWNNQDTCAFATTTPTISGNWSEELQESMSPAIATSFADFIKFVAGSTDEEFVANAETYFDVQSVIDFNILARVFCIVDNLCRNQIFFSYDGKKWYEGAWDFDAVLGNPPTARGFYAWNTAFQNGYVAYADHGVTNRLYERVETLFVDRFKARYDELRADTLSADNIIEAYERMTDVIKSYDGLLEEDYAATTGGGAYTGIPYKDENNIQQIRNFVAARLPYMDAQVAAIGEDDGNLLNGATLTNHAYIDFNNGDVVESVSVTSSSVVSFIPVEAGASYVLSSTNTQMTHGNVRFYDAEKNYLAGTNINDKSMPVTFIVPDGSAYVRFHVAHAGATEMPTIDDFSLVGV